MATSHPLILLVASTALAASAALPGSQGNYFVLTARDRQPPPFASVSVTCGPVEPGAPAPQWLQVEARPEPEFNGPPLFRLRVLRQGDPLEASAHELLRYQLQVPETGETLEYRNVHTREALTPGWEAFKRYFLPHAAPGSRRQRGLPETCEFLGHVLTLHHTRTNAPWEDWPGLKPLDLDPELLIGTSRPFRDAEGRRLPQKPERRNYTYVPFTAEDYRLMIQAGVNLFTINPDQEAWVRSEPVFYVRSAGRKSPLRYPTDLYRANYLGPVMFMDEPSILMVGDTNVHRTLKYFSDAAALIEKRTRLAYEDRAEGVWALQKALLDQRVNLGDLPLKHPDFPSWETLYDTAFYQMRGGGMGIVHEGRYQLAPFDDAVARFTGQPRTHTPAELLAYHYAFLRGGARPFGKYWGTAIYGQCDTNLAPLALTLAYDMGARYLWFWTSDHDHHVPWPEQLALARHLRAHVQAHPRPSIVKSPPPVEVAIAIPDGYFLSLENLWWVRALDKEARGPASQRYQRLMRRALDAVHDCFDRHLTFDLTVDDGRNLSTYKKIIRLSDEE